jgi:hypothetical protein
VVGIVWIPATTTSFLCLRQFVWWESPGIRCRGFFVCGYGRGVLLLGLFPPRNRTEEQRNACAHHISRRAQAHAGPARERRGRRAARREGPARRGRRHRPGAPVREGHGPVRQMWGAWPAVRPAGRAPLAASRHRLRQAPAGARAPEGRLRGARGDRRDGAVARRKSAYTRDFERQVAWLSVHAPRSAVSALMRVDWKSVGPICRRVPLGHRGVLEARREDRPPPLRHPAHHPVRTIQRSPGGRQQQDQDHHQDRLRLQEPRQPHRPGHAQMRRPQPPTPRTPITRKPDQ